MGHYLLVAEEWTDRSAADVVKGPITAINPEEAVKRTGAAGYSDLTVYSIEDDGEGEPESWEKEELDL